MLSDMCTKRRKICCVLFGSFFLLTVLPSYAQEELSASGLLTEATQLLGDQDYFGAIPYLKEYLERLKDSEDERVQALLQDVRFKLGKIYAYLEDAEAASTYFKEYTSGKPLYKRREALKLLAVNLYEIDDYAGCVSAVTNAFAEPVAEDLDDKKDKVKVEELAKEEMGGLTARQLKRFEEYAEEAGDDLFGGFSSDKPQQEPEYTPEELVLLNMTLAEAYSALAEWEKSIEPYDYVIENAADEERQGYAIMKMVSSLVELDRYEEAREFISQLYQTDARYDIRVNMALMTTASALYNAEEYDSALAMYRMVLPRNDLAAYQVGKMNEIRLAAGLPEVVFNPVTNSVGKVETLFGRKYQDSGEMNGEAGSMEVKPMELVDLEESVMSLVSLPPYENDVLYRVAQLYAAAGRPWEAVAAFNAVAANDAGGEMGQRAFFESLQVLLDPLKEFGRIETLAMDFLQSHTEGITPRQVAYVLTAAYQRQNKMKEIKGLLPYIEQFVFSDDFAVRQYECELYYMQAVADLVLLDYKKAKKEFADLRVEFPGSHQDGNASYWHAMCLLFLQQYEEAFAEFEAYPEGFPSGDWVDESAFRGGICLFGMEKYDEALARFNSVIETYPDSPIYPDACSLRGDIFASKGELDAAQRDYEQAIASAKKPEQAAYATFQMASMFEMESRYDEIIKVVNAYLDQYGEKADVAKAAYWIGKTKMEQGLTDEAVEAYLDTVVKYGGNVRQDGVDLIISELVKVSKWLELDEFDELRKRVNTALEAADNITLQLRLRVLLAEIDESTIDLGAALITELADLTKAPPPVLAVICEASFEKEDYSRSEEMLTLFQTRYEDSEFMGAALKLRGFDLYNQGDYEGAMKIVKEAQALYGTAFDMAWAQLMKGRIELFEGNLDVARETFRAVLNVRSWRGEPYAEATFCLGEVEEKSGDPRKAFAWYQRTYFQYKGHAQGYWAAEGYLASARCLLKMGRENDMRNTFRAMLFDKYVNQLPQANEARVALGPEEVKEITGLLASGVQTNVTVTIEAEVGE